MKVSRKISCGSGKITLKMQDSSINPSPTSVKLMPINKILERNLVFLKKISLGKSSKTPKLYLWTD